MFKKKLSIKAAFSAVMASFLFCLSLGKSAFAVLGTAVGLDSGNYDIIMEIQVDTDEIYADSATNVTVTIKNSSDNRVIEYTNAKDCALNIFQNDILPEGLYASFTEFGDQQLEKITLDPNGKVTLGLNVIINGETVNTVYDD